MSVFKFKQFEIDQSGCAMKINTDGVLLAVLAAHDQPRSILDIGTGTGVIAMMLAQRYEEAKVHAVEIDQQASLAAETNFRQSGFNNRLSVSHMAIEQFDVRDRFSLIVSNPPYFLNDLKNIDEKKALARHASEHFFRILLRKVCQLLEADGKFWFILPVKQADEMIDAGFLLGLFVQEQVFVHSDQSKPMIRKIVCLGKEDKTNPPITHFYIYQEEGVYTTAYKQLLAPFFIGY